MTAGRALSLWVPVAGFMLAVWFFADQGAREAPVVVWDKALHAGAYALFGGFCLRAFHGGLHRPWRAVPTAAALLLALGYGAADEWHQSWVPGRDASAADWIADAVGVVGSWVGLRLVGWLHPRERGG